MAQEMEYQGGDGKLSKDLLVLRLESHLALNGYFGGGGGGENKTLVLNR